MLLSKYINYVVITSSTPTPYPVGTGRIQDYKFTKNKIFNIFVEYLCGHRFLAHLCHDIVCGSQNCIPCLSERCINNTDCTWKIGDLVWTLLYGISLFSCLRKLYKLVKFLEIATVTRRIILQTVDLCRPEIVSPVTCWKVPDAKNRRVISTCFVAETG